MLRSIPFCIAILSLAACNTESKGDTGPHDGLDDTGLPEEDTGTPGDTDEEDTGDTDEPVDTGDTGEDYKQYCPIQVDITAPSGGNGSVGHPFQYIQHGIDAAPEYDCWEVEVHPGTYRENVDFLGYPVDVGSVDGPEVTTIDGGAAGSAVTFQSDEPEEARLFGFTVTNGLANRGGGILVMSTSSSTLSSPTIEGNIITANVAQGEHGTGGGVMLFRAGGQLIDNTISENDACYGGAEEGCDGGGVNIIDGEPYVARNIIIGNTAGDGGGIWVVRSEAVIMHNIIDGNACDDEGMVDDMGYSVYGQGGGVDFHTGSDNVVFSNNIVTNNRASSHGGGVSVFGYYDVGSSPTLTNNVIAYNDVGEGGYGAGLLIWGLSAPVVANNVMNGNHGTGVYGQFDYASYTYNNVWANTVDYEGDIGDPTGADGNLAVASLFASTTDDGDRATDDFHLRSTSSLKNAGDPAILNADGSRSDIGAYGGPAGEW